MTDSGLPTPAYEPTRPLADLPLTQWRPQRKLTVASSSVLRARWGVVDAHNHLGRWLTEDWVVEDVHELLDLMDSCGIDGVVNLDGRWGGELEANLERYDRPHPRRFATFCHVDWTVLQELPAGAAAEALAASVRRSVASGARGLKIWKDLGLHVRDAGGDLVLIDDPRLGPLFDTAGELGIPVAVHTADPVAFFDPIDPRNERIEQLLAYPHWSFADTARFPRFQDLIDAFERAIDAHPGTTIIGVHAGCFPENLAWVRRMFVAHPHFHVDIAARLAELGRQPRATRQLMIDFPDRVLFGSDCFPPLVSVYRRHFRFLETDDEAFSHDDEEPSLMGRWTISGVHLPDDVLAAVYGRNAGRIIPGLS